MNKVMLYKHTKNVYFGERVKGAQDLKNNLKKHCFENVLQWLQFYQKVSKLETNSRI